MGARISRILLNPLLLLVVLVAAVLTGIYEPEFAKGLTPIGGYYLSLLKMIVLPYLFVTITSGVARMASDPRASEYIARMVVVFPLAMMLAAAVALTCSILLPPGGQVDGAALSALGGIVSGGSDAAGSTHLEVALMTEDVAVEAAHPLDILARFIPENIFAALSAGDSLKTVIFCIVFGAALARHMDAGTRSLLDVFRVVQGACTQVIRWLNMLLPFALFAMISAQVAQVGLGPLLSLGRFIEVQALSGGILILLSALALSVRARITPVAAIGKLGDTIIMAISTRSSLACIPTAVREMTEKLRFDPAGIDLILPLGITMCRVATVSYLLIGTIFIAEVYAVEIDAYGYAVIFFASIAAGLAASGATGAMAVVLISLVAEPMNLPVEAAIVLFIAVDPIIDVVRTTVLVYGNCALAALILPKPDAHAAQGGAGRDMAAASRRGG